MFVVCANFFCIPVTLRLWKTDMTATWGKFRSVLIETRCACHSHRTLILPKKRWRTRWKKSPMKRSWKWTEMAWLSRKAPNIRSGWNHGRVKPTISHDLLLNCRTASRSTTVVAIICRPTYTRASAEAKTGVSNLWYAVCCLWIISKCQLLSCQAFLCFFFLVNDLGQVVRDGLVTLGQVVRWVSDPGPSCCRPLI